VLLFSAPTLWHTLWADSGRSAAAESSRGLQCKERGIRVNVRSPGGQAQA